MQDRTMSFRFEHTRTMLLDELRDILQGFLCGLQGNMSESCELADDLASVQKAFAKYPERDLKGAACTARSECTKPKVSFTLKEIASSSLARDEEGHQSEAQRRSNRFHKVYGSAVPLFKLLLHELHHLVRTNKLCALGAVWALVDSVLHADSSTVRGSVSPLGLNKRRMESGVRSCQLVTAWR